MKTSSSAKASLRGYLYQIRYTLLESIKRIKEVDNFDVYIEKYDDAAFLDGEGNDVIQQIKQHDPKHALTNASVDLWKTIGIWIKILNQSDGISNPSFYLVTTSNISSNHAPFFLQIDSNRNIDQAIMHLDKTAKESKNLENRKSYKAFNNLDIKMKTELVKNVYIIANNGDLDDLKQNLRSELYLVAPKEHMDTFIERLEGWWQDKVIQSIKSEKDTPINRYEIDTKIGLLREEFRLDNLPIDYELFDSDIDSSEFYDRTFVDQLKIIGIKHHTRIFNAVRNYYFAFNQMTRWTTDQLVSPEELERYKHRLISAWQTRFAIMLDEIDDCTDEDKICKAAREIYKWVETGMLEKIRSNVEEANISRGKYQMLSDNLIIGWHPKYEEKLEHFIKISET